MNDDRLREPPSERFDTSSLVLDLHTELAALRAETAPTKQGHRQKTLFKHSGRTIAVFTFDAGGELPEHSVAGTVTIQPIEGEVTVDAAGESRTLRTGQVLVIAPGTTHSLVSARPSAFLLQISLEH